VFESVFLSRRVLVMSRRPGRISAEVAVDFSYPRRSDLRMTAEYGALCRAVSARLAEASGGIEAA
jgi:NitT/TauT family transport system ATP-binding protein